MKFIKKLATTLAISGLCLTGAAQAAVTEVEGAAGGGIVPWALLSSGMPTVSATWVDTGDYTLSSLALQASFANRVELSYARMNFDTRTAANGAIGQIDIDVLSAKVKLMDMNGTMPAVAFGIQYKNTNGNQNFDNLLNNIGADDSDTDFYVAATSLIPIGDKKLLLNGTIRATRANQIGILGFKSKWEDDYEAQFETSIGMFLNEQTVIGVEYRMKPDNINMSGYQEQDWGDLFFAYFPSKNLSLTAAAAFFGDVVTAGGATSNPPTDAGSDQRGLYLQIQANF